MTQEDEVERAKWRSFWLKAGIVAAVLMAIGWISLGGICLMVWRASHKEETEDARMRRLVEQLGAEETDIRFVDMILYRSHRRAEAKRKLLAEGKRAVPFLIEGLHHENWRVGEGCADVLVFIPTKEGIAALIRCLGEQEKPVPLPSDIRSSLAAITGYRGGLDPRTFDNERDKEKARQVYEQWWEDYKDRLVEIPGGLGIRRPDGTVIPLPVTWDP
ncbi:MAG TPA: hypothetical protein VM238_14790 [Phycisphaerae bacterium]|nr:hypothetical protein [Phycisphaerae bacterium]